MTSLSDYMRAERLDFTEPASFYIPGVQGWNEMNRREARVYLAGRVRDPDEEISTDDGTFEQLH